MLKKLREWNRTRKKNNHKFKVMGMKRMDKLADKYMPDLPKHMRDKITLDFMNNIRAFHDYPSYILAQHNTVDYSINAGSGGFIALASALGMPVGAGIVLGGLGVKYALHYRDYKKIVGGVRFFSKRTIVDARGDKDETRHTINHEAAHFISMKIKKNKLPNSREEGLAEYIALLELKPPNKHIAPKPGESEFDLHVMRGIWSNDLSLSDKRKNHVLFFKGTKGWAGQYIHYIALELNKLAKKDVRVDVAKELMMGKPLDKALLMAGLHSGVDKKKLKALIKKHKPANA